MVPGITQLLLRVQSHLPVDGDEYLFVVILERVLNGSEGDPKVVEFAIQMVEGQDLPTSLKHDLLKALKGWADLLSVAKEYPV